MYLPIFRSPSCGHCASVERPALDRLGAKLGVRIEPKIHDVDDIENYKLLLRLEQELGDSDNDFPIVVVGKKLLAGNEEIEKGLEPAFRDWLAAGGPAGPAALSSQPSPAEKTVSGKPVYAAFFSQGGCAECDRVIRALSYLKSRYPSLKYRLYDTREAPSARLLEAIMEERGVPDADRTKTPSFFVGSAFLLEKSVTPFRMEEAVAACMAQGTTKPWEASEEALQAADSRIRARFSKLGLWTVIAAGLIDGINPCAFATIVFFVGYLVTTKRGAREVLVVGGCFTAAVFLTYLAVGAGALGAITRLRAYAFFSRALDVGAGGFALLLGSVSAVDWWKARKGKLDEMRLVLPGFLKRRINLNISKQLRLRGIVLGAIVAGALVSLFELACTGQVYLPTLALISGDAVLKAKALSFLVLYNLLFVLPLIVIVVLAAAGLGSQRLSGFFLRHVAASKLALTLLFFAIGAVVLVNALRQ